MTIRHRCNQVQRFENWLRDQGTKLLDAQPCDIDRYLDDACAIEATTRSTYMAYLASFYRWAERGGLIERSPVALMERPKIPDRHPRPIDDDELTIALEEADPRMRAWLLLGRLQGMRVSSMARLTVEGIDRRNMRIRFWAKGDREHAMPLHPLVLAALDAYGLPESGFVFCKQSVGQGDRPLTANTISHYVNRFLRELGSDATGHQLRHAFITKLVENTGDIHTTAGLAGHRSIETTNGYAKAIAEKGRAAMRTLDL